MPQFGTDGTEIIVHGTGFTGTAGVAAATVIVCEFDRVWPTPARVINDTVRCPRHPAAPWQLALTRALDGTGYRNQALVCTSPGYCSGCSSGGFDEFHIKVSLNRVDFSAGGPYFTFYDIPVRVHARRRMSAR